MGATVAGSLAMFGGLLGTAAAIDQFAGHGWTVVAGIVLAVLFALILLGLRWARPSTARTVLSVVSALCLLGAIGLAVVGQDRARAAEPLSLTVERNTDSCDVYVFDKPLDQLGPPPDSDSLGRWAVDHGGIEAAPIGYATQSRVLVTVAGATAHPVTITGLQFHVTTRRALGMKGTVAEEDCGGPTLARFVEVNLDKVPARIVDSSAEVVEWGSTTERGTPLQFPYRVTDTDTETLLIMADTNGYAEWTAELDYSDGHTAGHWTIDNHGKPFRAAAVSDDSTHYTPDAGHWDKL